MAFKYASRVKETTTTTGTGTINLAGASTGFRGFVAAIGDGNTCVYEINDGAGNWEIGVGTVTDGSPDTLSRDTVIENSAGTTAKINFGSGTKDVFVAVPGAHLNQSPNELTISSGAVTATQLVHTIDTEGDAASDDLDTINAGGLNEGQVLTLLAANAARKVYLTTAGNIAHPCLLSSTRPTRYMLIGSSWYCLENEVLLDLLTASGSASLDFTKGIGSAYDHYGFRHTNILPATDGATLRMLVSEDAGANWKTGASDYAFNVQTLVGGVTSAAGDDTAAAMDVARVLGNAAGEALSGKVEMFGPSATGRKQFTGTTGHWDNAGTAALRRYDFVGSYYGTTNAINGVRFLMDSGNITSGTIAFYGLRK